jgi:hypothetical protein
MGKKKSRFGSGMSNPSRIKIPKALETIFRVEILKFFDADANPGIFLTLDPGWKKFGSATLE